MGNLCFQEPDVASQPLSTQHTQPNSAITTKQDPVSHWKEMKPHVASLVHDMLNGDVGEITKDSLPCDPELCLSILRLFRYRENFSKNLLRIDVGDSDVHFVGDIHGSYHYLVDLIAKLGHPTYKKYVFLGDYVDKGPHGVYVCLLLFSLRLLYPKNVFLLRGNHEKKRSMGPTTGKESFEMEIINRFMEGGNIFDICECLNACFCTLPLATIINGKVFAVHGGISKDLKFLKDIDEKKPNRKIDVPKSGLMFDLLWSDPDDREDFDGDEFVENDERGSTTKFSMKAAFKFMERNNIEYIVRGHEFFREGFKKYKYNERELIISIHSTPHYEEAEKTAIAIYSPSKQEITVKSFETKEEKS